MRVKSEERRQAILDVAKELFIQRGFETTSMSEISSRVGGSKATLYNYFASRRRCLSRSWTLLVKIKFPKLSCLSIPVDIESELQKMGFHYLSFILEPEVMAIRTMALHEASRSDIGRQFYEQGPKRGWRLIRDYLLAQRERQRLRFEDPWSCAMHLLESEVVEPFGLGVISAPRAQTLRQIVERAVSVFMAAYGR